MKRKMPPILEMMGIFILIFAIVNAWSGWIILNRISQINIINIELITSGIRAISLFYIGKIALSTSKNFLYGERDAREKFSKNGLTYIVLKYLYLGFKFLLVRDISLITNILPSLFLNILFYNVIKFALYSFKEINEHFTGKSGVLTKSRDATIFNEVMAIMKKLKEMTVSLKSGERLETSNFDVETKNLNKKNIKTREVDKILIEKLEINQKIKTHSTVLDGGFRNYFDNGLLYEEGHYKSGKLDGRYVQYFKNGRIYIEGYYDNGHQVGQWKTFEENGKLLKEEVF
ncbi:toxin-antitoxin system YwqK family antitoxin [Fusobacterium sp. PH5-44]|uniref:toxin-antitoxin system YwqK family antitoxin n=1 Tax=unclassified Fusobacterium TaxID=2648384 RepID=UPI003D25F126